MPYRRLRLISDNHLRHILEANGCSSVRTARHFGVATSTVCQELHRRGIKWKADEKRRAIRVKDQELVALLKANHLNARPVAELLGVGLRTLGAELRRRGIRGMSRPGVRKATPTTAILRRMYVDEGMTLDAIAHHYDVTLSCVFTWMKKAGVPRRPAGYPRSSWWTPTTGRAAGAVGVRKRWEGHTLRRAKEKYSVLPGTG